MRRLFIILILALAMAAHAQIVYAPLSISSSNPTLTVTPTGSGSGSITSLDLGINACGISGGVTSGTCGPISYTSGTSITLNVTTTGVGGSTFFWSSGTGDLLGFCSGTGPCGPFTITQNDTITGVFLSATSTAIPAFPLFVLGLNVSATGCPKSGGFYPSTINHGGDRWWDFLQGMYAYINTALHTYAFSKADDELCAANQFGVHNTQVALSRVPNYAESGKQYTDAGTCSYVTFTRSVKSPTVGSVTALSESGSTVTATSSFNPGAGNQVVLFGDTPAGYDGQFTVLVSDATHFTYTDATTGLGAGTVFGTVGLPSPNPGFTAGQCDPENDLNADGTGTDQNYRDYIGALVSHTQAPGYSTTHANLSAFEILNEPDTPKFFSGIYGSYDIQIRKQEDTYCILKGGAWIVQGAVNATYGVFTPGETVTQNTTGATATLMGAPRGTELMNFTAAPTSGPADGNTAHYWLGGTSAARYYPTSTPGAGTTAAPMALTVRATGENCATVRAAVTHGAGSTVVNTTVWTNFPTQPLDLAAQIIMPSYHGQGIALEQGQCFLYCGNPTGAPSGNGCVSSGNTAKNSTGAFVSCHAGGWLTAEAMNWHLKFGSNYASTGSGPNGPAEWVADYWVGNIEGSGSVTGILLPGEQAKPLWDTEAGYSTCGWPDPTATPPCDSGDPNNDPDMESAYIVRTHLYAVNKGIANYAWYNWNPSKNADGLGAACSISPVTSCPSQGYNWIYNQLVGSIIAKGSATTTAPANAGSGRFTYTVPVTLPGGAAGAFIWDNSESCSAGTCGTTSQLLSGLIAGSFTTWTDVFGTVHSIVAGHVPVGIRPILVQ